MTTRTRAARPAPAATAPAFGVLTPEECEKILARNSVGRLAFSFHDRVDIEPIHYAYAADRLFGRTSEGTKIATLRHSPWVAFEVDEVDDIFDWRSVVVHGTIYQLPADGSVPELHARAQALALLRQVVPATGREDDPVAFRDIVFEIIVDAISGRVASTGRGRKARRAPRPRAAPAG